jgi:hypothetical protein
MRGGRLAIQASQRLGAIAGHCGGNSSAPARIVSEMRARLQPQHREEAQMLAEMNLPMMRIQAQAAAAAANEQLQEAKCARETALREAAAARREAERARQDARRMRHEATLTVSDEASRPIVLKLDELPRINQRIQIKTDALQRHIQVRTVQLTADQLYRIDHAVAMATANLDRVDFSPVIAVETAAPWKCGASHSWSQQMQVHYGSVMRHALQSIHNSLNVTTVHQGSGSSL